MNESSSISGCIGITVSGQGSFTFNNTDGIVNIGGFAGTVFDMSGGTIKLEGAETNVSSDGGFLLYLSNQRYGGTQNKIDFNAQKATIKGTSKGIYADTNSINNHVSFKGDVDIEVQGNGYYDGIAVAYALALLDSEDIRHPRLEVIITVDEEVGMDGAREIDLSMLQGHRMINLDSEDEAFS